jgi:UDP-N-acetylmuramyl pentapeptide phosphotransferase/UDP-N-acetylglucosamine-1-phosphate transferase
MIEPMTAGPLVLGPVALLALALSSGLIILLRPWLARLALARPNERSSHRAPTPQGAGLAVMAATLAVAWTAIALTPDPAGNEGRAQFLVVTPATILLMVVGIIDGMRSLPVTLRLTAECVAVAAVIAALPPDLRILPQVSWSVERAGLFIGALWFVNLVNFMDGIDWMTVAELVPVTAAVMLMGPGTIGWSPAIVAAALLGAMLAFAPFNKPVAKLFLGDAGSLPIGLVLSWLLLQLAARGHLAAALILPLYYLADATFTLARRLANRELIWQAHRTHFYQRATAMGFSVLQVVGRVFAVNLILAALALVSVAAHDPLISATALTIAAAVVAMLLLHLARGSK